MAAKNSEKYIESVGRRKTSVARVRITPASKQSYEVEGKTLAEYFDTTALQQMVESPFTESGLDQKFAVTVRVSGGGTTSQAESIRLGISRSLIKFNQELRKDLKKAGYLKRDPRVKERKKPGLKKARKSPQWSKR